MAKSKQCCLSCQQSFIPCRNPKQQYCKKRTCQSVRKRLWRKQKYKDDSDYRENQKRVAQSFHEKHPHYWKNYRAAHPEYVERNREQQRLRQHQWRLQQAIGVNASQFANCDALPLSNSLQKAVRPGLYRLLPEGHPEFANRDAFLVQIAVVSGTMANSS